MKNLSFEVHAYAPELNTIYLNGVNINKLFYDGFRMHLTKDYQHNLKQLRFHLKPKDFYKMFWFVAERPNGTREKKFYVGRNSTDVINLFKQFKSYYNVEGTKHKIELIK